LLHNDVLRASIETARIGSLIGMTDLDITAPNRYR